MYKEGDILKNPAAESYVIVSIPGDGSVRIKSLNPANTDPPGPFYGNWDYIGNGIEDPALQARIVKLVWEEHIINSKLWQADKKYMPYYNIYLERRKAKKRRK